MADAANRPVRGKLLVYFDAHQFELTEAEQDKILDGLDSLALQVENFPQHDLRATWSGDPATTSSWSSSALSCPAGPSCAANTTPSFIPRSRSAWTSW